MSATKQLIEDRVVAALIAARHQSGLRQAQLAKKLGYSQSWVARLEGGKRRIAVDEIYRLAKVLHADPQQLLSGVFREVE